MTPLCCYVNFFLLPKIFVEVHQSSNHDNVFFFLFPLDTLMDINRCMYWISALCQWEQIHVNEGRAAFLW